MTAGLSVPAYSVQVSFTDPWDTPDWVDVTRWCKKGTTHRGRQHELQRAQAGTCALTISNQDGRFSTFNASSPYVNIMTAADSYFQDQPISSTPGSWGNTTNCALALVGNLGFDGYPAMSLTASSAATMSASTGTLIVGAGSTYGYVVTAGNTYGFQAQFLTAVTARACSVGVGWYNSGNTLIGSVVYGSTVNDNASTYTKATLTATAPAGAVNARLFVKVASPANAEVHYVTRCMISNAGKFGNVSTGWAPGGRGLVPARPVKVEATWSSTNYPVFYGYVDSWLPSYGVALSDQVLNCTDGMTLLALSFVTTSYIGQILADGAAGYWPLSDLLGSLTAADQSVPGTTNGLATGNNPLVVTPGAAAPTFGQTGILGGNTQTAAQVANNVEMQSSRAAYAGTTGFTVEAVMDAAAITANFFVYLSDGTRLYGPAINSDGTAEFLVDGVGWVTTATGICDNKAHHLALSVSSAGAYACYVDGISVGSGSGASATTSDAYTPYVQGLGTTVTAAAVSVTPSALTGAQIAVHSALSKSGFIQQQSGQRITAVLDALGVPSSLQSIATGISAVQSPQSALTTTPALSYIQTVENTEQGFFFVDESGIFTYYDRHYILQNAAATTSNGTFANDTNGGHYKFLTPLIPAADALDLWNDAPVSAIANASLGVTGVIQDYPNTDSERWYGRRTLQGYQSMLQTTDTEAASLSQWLVAHYGLPIERVRQMKLDSTAQTPSSLPQMLGRKLWERITIQWQPIDGTASPFEQDSLVENIEHSFGPDLWTTTWGLSVAETQSYLTLNSATLGTLAATGALTGNRLGF